MWAYSLLDLAEAVMPLNVPFNGTNVSFDVKLTFFMGLSVTENCIEINLK